MLGSLYLSSAGDNATRRVYPFAPAVAFTMHVFVAMAMGSLLMVIAGRSRQSFSEGRIPSAKVVVETGGLLNPFVWVPGVLLGVLFSRVLSERTARRAACWVWIVGGAWLAAAIWDSVRHYDARYYQGCSNFQNVVNAFFILDSSRCGGGERSLAGLFFTIPAINSVGYSLAAWFAVRLGKEWSRARAISGNKEAAIQRIAAFSSEAG